MAKISICVDTDSNEVSTVTQSNNEIIIKIDKSTSISVDDVINNMVVHIANVGSIK